MITELLATTDVDSAAGTVADVLPKALVPLVILATLGMLVLRWGTERLTATSVVGTLGVGALLSCALLILPNLTRTLTFEPTDPRDSDAVPELAPYTLIPTRTTTPPPPTPTSATPPPATEPGHPVDWTWVAQAAMVIGIAVVAVVIGSLLWLVVSRHRAAHRAAAAKRAAQLQRWANGVSLLKETSLKLWDFEDEPESVYFTRPLLADVDEPASAAFYTAYAQALALHTETVPSDDDQITAFVTAAAAAARAFGRADENARRKGRLGVIHNNRKLTREEKRRVDQARKLLAQALDPATGSEHAKNAQAKAHEILDQIGLVIPERLTTKTTRSIEALHKPALTAAPADTVLVREA